MFGKRISLFRLFGFSVYVDLSWIIIAVLVTSSLAANLFPVQNPGLTPAVYWMMGIIGALGLFASIVFHEMSHSLVARRSGLAIRGITLFIFGGVAEMEDEPPNPQAEFFMAVAGPLSSVLLAFIFFGLYRIGLLRGWAEPVNGVFQYLGWINGVLALFNLVPAFPLDGGRAFRSILWAWKKDLRRATRTAARFGAGFGVLLIFFGALNAFRGNFVGGIWQFLIGLFLRDAAQMSYRQVVARQALEGTSVRRFMRLDPVTVSPSLSLADLMENYIYRYPFGMYPVMEGNHLIGSVEINQLKEIPREEWPHRTVGEVARPCSAENTIAPEADAVRALAKMNRTRSSRLLVVDQGRLVGVLSLKDLLRFLSLKVEFEENGREAA